MSQVPNLSTDQLSRIKPLGARIRGQRGAFTLLEVLIATGVTLLMMVSLTQIFRVIGESMKQGRAAVELNNRLRNVTYRLRTDLDNCTVTPNPPSNHQQSVGYMQVYDGMMTDFSYAQAGIANSIGDLSRFGDLDDVLMFTARAGDVWFTGKVPLFVLLKTTPVDGGVLDNTQMVTIAAQHAEIAVFAEPVVSADAGNETLNTTPLITSPGTNYRPLDETLTLTNKLPAQYRLYYRTLLIRPDLNLPSGILPNSLPGAPKAWFLAQPTTLVSTLLPSPACDMMLPYQQCDLSIRRTTLSSAGSPTSFVTANSLADLANPAARFAHYQFVVPGTASTYSMPLLALTPYVAGLPRLNTSDTLSYESRFLHPAYTLIGERTGEDVIADNVLAFDVKVFDPAVSLLGLIGKDGVEGVPGSDISLGAAGSDDLVLSPNDPGYGTAMMNPGAKPIGTGEYVDLCWGLKTRLATRDASGGLALPAGAATWTPFSGLSAANFAAGQWFTDGLFKSGQVLNGSAGITANIFLQPSYDTWTTAFESDGVSQAEASGFRGVVVNPPSYLESWRATVLDAGTDGIDNNAIDPANNSGIDEAAELETSAPFPYSLRGLRIQVRMEDPAARQVKQMSVEREFVSEG
ncbi:MAG: hypothetical protein KDB03_18600 [Planctomycetales bacterium]|nr:hypothetical protein [Planctomycetales bacterium]